MANLRDIRRRIKSIKNTAQITRAMQLVAASKMKKAQDQALASRAYAQHLEALLRNLKEEAENSGHPLLVEREGKRELIIVITTDKGLCGGLNTNLLRKLLREAPSDASYVSVGAKGRTALSKLKKDLLADFQVRDPVHFNEVKRVAKFAVQKFLEGEIDVVKVAFTNFVNTLVNHATITQLLPLDASQVGEKREYDGMAGVPEPMGPEAAAYSDYLFEPDRPTVFEQLLPLYVNYLLFQMMLESRAAEHSSRMVAMKSATDNAKGIVKDLTLEYNKLRQAAITNELLEITTAQMAIS
jgi:F-type H+-transporting ATPase subunit gamma